MFRSVLPRGRNASGSLFAIKHQPGRISHNRPRIGAFVPSEQGDPVTLCRVHEATKLLSNVAITIRLTRSGAIAMSWRLRSVRKRILLLAIVPVLSLFGLFVFTTSVSARNAINLARVATVKNITEQPASQFLGAIDVERPLAIVYLADPSPVNRAGLNLQAQKTNRAVEAMRAAVTSSA